MVGVFVTFPAYSQALGDKSNEKIGKEIIFGQSGGFSGDTKSVSESISLGAQAYFNYVNKNGGVHGRTLKIVTRDDAYKADKAKENTFRFIKDDNVFALFGYTTIATSRSAIPFVTEYKVPFLAAFTGNGALRNPFNRQIVHFRASHNAELSSIVEHLSSFETKKIAFSYYADSTANLKDMQEVMKNYPNIKLSIISMERNESDLDRMTSTIVRENPDALVMVMVAQSVKKVSESLKKKGFNAPVYITSFAGTNSVINAMGETAYGIVISQVVPAPYNRSIQIVQEYQSIFKASYPNNEYTYESLESFIAARIIVEALKRAGPDLTREKFLQSIDNLNELDFGGYIITYDKQNREGSNWVELTMVGKNKKIIY